MDNGRLVAVLGSGPHTPLEDAVRATLVGLGCMPAGGNSPGQGELRGSGPLTLVDPKPLRGTLSQPRSARDWSSRCRLRKRFP